MEAPLARMHPVAEQLLEQHIAFELDALTDKRVQPFIRSTVQRWFELADVLSLDGLAPRKRCEAAFRRLFVDSKIPASAAGLGVSLFLCAARRLEDSGAELEAILGRDQFLELVDLTVSLHQPRRRLVTSVFSHPLYSELISSLVYEALLNYVIHDNVISQRVPGVGSMLKLGRKFATRAVPGLDASVEKQLKGYIKAYLPSLISTSEQFVEAVMTDEALLDEVAQAWPEIGSMQLSGMTRDLRPEDVERMAAWSRGYWNELRSTDWFEDMGDTLIAHVFERYGDQPVATLLDDLGITRAMVTKELLAFGPPLLKRLRRSGLLGELLRLRLTPFYESEAVANILKSIPSR